MDRYLFPLAGVFLCLPGVLPAADPVPGQITYEAGDRVRIEFPSSPVAAILPYYEKLTGKRIIRDAKIEGVELSVTSSEPIPLREAISYIESALLLNGYALIPVDDNTVKVVNFEAGKSPRSQGLPVIVSPDKLPQGEAVINYVMTLDYISPEEAARSFSQVVTLNPYGAITPLNAASAVVITENSSVVRSLIELKEHFDVPSSQVSSEIIDLQRADAEKVAEILNQVFGDTAPSAAPPVTNGTAPSPPSGPQATATPPSAPAPAEGKPPVKVIAYGRTNSLMVVGRPMDLAYLHKLVEAFDKPTDASNFLQSKLRYVSIVEYLPAFYNAIARNTDVGKRENLLKPEDVQQGGGQAAAVHNGGSGGSGGFRGGSSGFGGSASGMGGGGIYPDRLSEPEPFTSPQSYVVGNTLLIADPQANTLIVSGSPEHIEIIQRLIEKVDVQPKQVYLSTIIGQMALGDELQYSLDFFRQFSEFKAADDKDAHWLKGSSLDNSGGSVIGAVNPYRGIGSATSRGLALLGSYIDTGRAPIDIILRMLTRDQNFRLLSRPSVYAQNNSKATILSGQRIAVPTSTLTSVGGAIPGTAFPGSLAANIEYLDVVLKLEVIPLINSDKEVTLRIAQVNDTVVGQQVISGNTIPTLSTQELTTTITVPNGQTVVLGGLITEKADRDKTGVPIIRRIPILKQLVGSTDREFRREELLIFIQPFIIDGCRLPGNPNVIEMGRTDSAAGTMQFGDPNPPPVRPVSRRRGAVPSRAAVECEQEVVSVSEPAKERCQQPPAPLPSPPAPTAPTASHLRRAPVRSPNWH